MLIKFAVTPIDGLCYRVIDSSILQDIFFHLSQNLKKKQLRKDKKKLILQYGHVFRKDCFVVFTASRFPYVILCPNLMTVQTSKSKVPHIYKKLIRRIITFKYEKLLLLKSSPNKVASTIAITKQNKTSQTYHICQKHFEIKMLILLSSQQFNVMFEL